MTAGEHTTAKLSDARRAYLREYDEGTAIQTALTSVRRWKVAVWLRSLENHHSLMIDHTGKKSGRPRRDELLQDFQDFIDPDTGALHSNVTIVGNSHVKSVEFRGDVASLRAFGNAFLSHTGLQLAEDFPTPSVAVAEAELLAQLPEASPTEFSSQP